MEFIRVLLGRTRWICTRVQLRPLLLVSTITHPATTCLLISALQGRPTHLQDRLFLQRQALRSVMLMGQETRDVGTPLERIHLKQLLEGMLAHPAKLILLTTLSAENRKPSLSDRIADKFASGTEKMKNLFSGSSKKKTSDGDQWSNALESEIPRGSVNPKDGHEIYEGMPLAPRAPTPSSRLKTQQSMGRLRSYTAPGGQAPMRPSTSQGQHSRRNIPANRDNWAPYGDHQEGTAIGGQRGNTYQETSSRTTSRELQTRSRSRNDTTTSKNTDTTSLTSSYFYGENSPMFRRDANWQGPLPLTPRSSSLRRTHRVEPERANNSSPLERRSPSSTKRRSNDMKGYDARPPSPNAPKIDETMLRQVKEAQRRQL